jgi:hypothetical protein
VLIDEHMHLDYFAKAPVWGPSFVRCRYRMRMTLFLTILDRVCARDSCFFVEKKCLWLGGAIYTPKNHCHLADACTGCVRRCHG